MGEQLDLEGDIFVFNLDFDALGQAAAAPLFTPLPRYPAVYRDIALVVPEGVPAARVAQALYSHGRPWLVEARLFDVYTGDHMPPGKRSLAFRLSYRDPERTLTDELVNSASSGPGGGPGEGAGSGTALRARPCGTSPQPAPPRGRAGSSHFPAHSPLAAKAGGRGYPPQGLLYHR